MPWRLGRGRQVISLFARYLDLSPLKGRRQGLVRCIWHQERTGSLSVDLDKGLFHCFGCGVGGGVRRFADLVGERSAESVVWDAPESLPLALLAGLRSQARLGAPYAAADAIRDDDRWVAWLRAEVVDDETSWERLADAAAVETGARALEVVMEHALGRLKSLAHSPAE